MSDNVFPHSTAMRPGLELRDYFAAAALAGLLHDQSRLSYATVASRAYHFADAMLAVRMKTSSER